jgi:putative SOS response-associated peptidase YedK
LAPQWQCRQTPGRVQRRRIQLDCLQAKPDHHRRSFKGPWARTQRCVIPAVSFDEPCWETGRNVWWTFKRSDGAPWGLAGLWATWTDPETGEVHESYTMLTINADADPLMSRMH